MRINIGQQPRQLWPDAGRPAVRVGQKESLLRRVAVNHARTRFACERLLPRGVSDDETAQICDRLADDELAVLVQSRLDLKAVELVDDAFRARVEILQV